MTAVLDAILTARSQRLASVPSRAVMRAGEEHVVVEVDQIHYAIHACYVVGVAAVKQLAKLPGVPIWSAGLLSFRGAPVVAFNSSKVLFQARQRLAERTLALVIGRQQVEAALLIDSISLVEDINVESLTPAPESLAARARELILGVTGDGVVVLNPNELFESQRLLARTYLRRQA
jgi:chemotaxis signal transduction protein